MLINSAPKDGSRHESVLSMNVSVEMTSTSGCPVTCSTVVKPMARNAFVVTR